MVNIIACIKQVPDTETLIKVKGDGTGIEETGIKYVMCPYDEYGVEEALKTKEGQGGGTTVVCLGPDRVVESIRTALAMGMDKAVHIKADADQGSDGFATAKALADVIKDLEFDIIFCGKKAIDGDQHMTGVMLAEMLGISHAGVVNKVEIVDGKAKCIRPIEGGQEVIEVPLPAIVTCEKGLNEPRYASLPGIMKAKKKPLEVKETDVSANRKTNILKYEMPPERKAGRIVEGELPDTAVELVKLLREEAKII
jgi:electron transfer flavoprotein beta subunit